jgi:hypothetical protein
VLKLRTMVVGAETMGAGYAVDKGDSPHHARGPHPSPHLGRRASAALEHRPWDMSVIGPRPTLRYQVEQYDEHQRHRLDIRPGTDRLGAGPRPCGAAVGGSHRARRLVRREPVAAGRCRDPPAHATRPLPRDLSRARRAAGASAPSSVCRRRCTWTRCPRTSVWSGGCFARRSPSGRSFRSCASLRAVPTTPSTASATTRWFGCLVSAGRSEGSSASSSGFRGSRRCPWRPAFRCARASRAGLPVPWASTRGSRAATRAR